MRSYSNLLSISQIGHQWSDRSPRWITSLSRFYHPSGRQSRPAGPSRPGLDSPPGSRTIERDRPPIEDQWKKADIDVLRVGSLTASSQPSSCRFTHGSPRWRGLTYATPPDAKRRWHCYELIAQARGLIRLL